MICHIEIRTSKLMWLSLSKMDSASDTARIWKRSLCFPSAGKLNKGSGNSITINSLHPSSLPAIIKYGQRRVYRKRGPRRKYFWGPSELVDKESETLVVFSLSCAKTYEVELEAVFVQFANNEFFSSSQYDIILGSFVKKQSTFSLTFSAAVRLHMQCHNRFQYQV